MFTWRYRLPSTLLIFLLLPRPTRSTLFPYTTLFRSSKQFRHGATSKSRSNTASNSTKHKSPHLSEVIYVWCRSEERFSRNAETDLVCRLLLEKKKMRSVRVCCAIKSMNESVLYVVVV